ncbi:NACHT domain-containing protein [Streptomyces sp. NPDC048257]|uniref:NACHT domain-containing protein n=1 Tax=Streptomyces sp. NPDC048257 TaxID=3365526 RepID=UPI00372096EC
MDASVVGIRLASGVVTPLVRKLFRTEGAGAGLVDRPHRISSYLAWREKRELDAADLRGLADHLVKEALRAPGERPLPPGEEAGVAAALAATLHALGDLTLSDVEAVRLGPQAFARTLRAAAPDPGLSRDAGLFHARLVDLACLHILNFFTQRSTFVAATLVEQSRLHAETIAKVDELLTRVPRQDGRDTAFEERYLDYLARRHSTLTIFGLDLAPGSSRWPLDTAYVSLEVSTAPVTGMDAGSGAGTGAEALPAPYSLPADRLLAEHPRVLLRGEAGSGKTTLIQWLAVSAARTPGAGIIPFVLPLRTLTRHGERLPAPRDFLAGCPLAGEAPGGWEGRVLRDGRALLLVDGIDEIPEAERDRARDWLADLIAACPGNRWLVTSRPTAVRQDWLAAVDFSEVTLTPMNPANVRAFIEHWHAAADHTPPEYREQLLDSVAKKPDLARLATNPLLCGMICALHRERRGFLPSGRKELYAASLSMLLHRRDRERGLRLPDLAEEPQLQLLQRLAYWLIRNGRTEMDRSRAEALIEDALPAVPAAGVLGGAPAVFAHFLERTGLLRAPTENSVEFVHRTFQDFLGARAALDEGGLGELTGHAEDDQWEDVIRMAVAQGRPRDRAEIIQSLLARKSQRSVLLALACLGYAAELAPALRREVQWQAGRLIPPTGVGTARELGRIGPLILELLPQPEQVPSGPAALYTVQAAGGVVSELAVPFLAGFAQHPAYEVRAELARLWPRFETRRYAAEVISRLPPAQNVTVVSDAELAALAEFSPRSDLNVVGEVTGEALTAYLGAVRAEYLALRGNGLLTDLDFLRGQDALLSIEISHCSGIQDLEGLRGLPVRTAVLDLRGGLLPIGPVLAGWTSLRHLVLRGAHANWSLDGFAPRVELDSVNVYSVTPDAAGPVGLSRHRRLRSVSLGEHWAPRHPDEWQELALLTQLTELAVPASALDLVPEGLCLPSVEQLHVPPGAGAGPVLARRIPTAFPGLQMLSGKFDESTVHALPPHIRVTPS